MDNSHDSNKPVAWAVYWGHTFAQKHSVYFSQETANMAASEIKSFPTEVRPLYTSPQPAQPLTDAQHRENFESWFKHKYHDRLDRNMPDKSYNSPHANATWIGWCAAHNIKENT